MMPWFIWKNQNSLSDYGLWISKLPKRMRGEERHEEVEIPGRAGSVILLEGEDVYEPYVAEIVVVTRNDINVDRAIDWLRGSSDLILITDIDKAYSARIVGEVAFERISNTLQQATIPFLCQPFRHNRYQAKDRMTFTASGTINNPGDVTSKPNVQVTCTGTVAITIADKTLNLYNVAGTIKIDCDAKIITVGNNIWQGTYSGEYWDIPVGSSPITITGVSATVVIDPNWRWM